MFNKPLSSMCYGGDYNPDQWPESIWQEDMRLFKLAGINIITLPVFSWAKLEPREGEYQFDWLDKVMDLAKENNLNVCMATSTAVQPAWMSKKYPDMLPVDIDGRRRTFGGRVNFCPNNEHYRKASVKLATQMAKRYKDHPSLLIWHIGNEYNNYCYCDTCQEKFRDWVKRRYKTIEEVNERWYMSFWGHTLYSFDEITVPSTLSEVWFSPNERTNFQGIVLDYKRFMSESIMECYLGEYKAIKAITPDVPITTNFMGTFKPLNYFEWAKHMDIISWDNYPSLMDEPYKIAMRHDLMRGLKAGQPFLLMEQTPSQQNWQPYNSVKRPGVMRLQSYQAVAHGSDSVMFFQLRRSRGACEKYHAAVIEHVGHENTRVFRECAQLGEELKKIGTKTMGATINSKVAILFDWENWWAVELSSGPSIALNYIEQVEKYYKAFHDANISVDFVDSSMEIDKYDIVVAPVLYMVKPGLANRLEKFVENGGTFVTTFFSGYVDENDLVTLGGYPGELRKLMGIWVEEIDALFPEQRNGIQMVSQVEGFKQNYSCGMLCDIMHLEGATALANYTDDFYKDTPVITCNNFGKGKAYYIGSDPEESFISDFINMLCNEKGIRPPLNVPFGVELTIREKDSRQYLFVLNNNTEDVEVDFGTGVYVNIINREQYTGVQTVKSKDVLILTAKDC